MKRALFLFLAAVGALRAADEAVDPDSLIDDWIASIGSTASQRNIAAILVSDTQTEPDGKSYDFMSTFGGSGTYRIETTGEAENRVFAYDGNLAWEKSDSLGFGKSSYSTILSIYQHHDPYLPATMRGWYLSAVLVSDETYDGKHCRSYRVKPKGKGAIDQLWTVEADTGRLRTISSGMGDRRSVLSFDDYRSILVAETYTLTFPFRVTLEYAGGKTVIQRKAIEVGTAQSMGVFQPSAQDTVDAEKVMQVLEKYSALARTPDQAANLHSRKLVENISTAATGISTRRTVTLKQGPDGILIDDVTAGMGETLEGFDGKVSWELSDILGYRPLKPQESHQVFSGLFPEASREILTLAPLRKLIGERIVDERKTVAIGLANERFALGVYYFDAEDGHLLRVAFSKKPYARVPDSTIDYTDFKPVNGIDVAFTSIITSPAVQSVISIESIDDNVPVDDSIFAPRKKFDRPKPVHEASTP